MTLIVKVQKPLMSTEGRPSCLVYGHIPGVPKYRARFLHDLPTHVWKALETEPKAYFEATWSAALDNWIVGDRVGPQDW